MIEILSFDKTLEIAAEKNDQDCEKNKQENVKFMFSLFFIAKMMLVSLQTHHDLKSVLN